MKLRRREINIFSMSALDLFASGMGAFILLTVMALPFFPNTGDSEERIEAVKEELSDALQERDAARARASRLEAIISKLERDADAEAALHEALTDALRRLEDARNKVSDLEDALAKEKAKQQPIEPRDDSRERELEQALVEARKQRDAAEALARGLEDALKKVKMPDLDVVICLDVTASMTNQIDGFKREVSALAEVLDSLAPSAGIGVVAFGDRRWAQPIHEQPVVSTSNLAVLRAFVDSLRPNMDPRARRNTDGPEAVTTALERAVESNWRHVSKRRYVIVVTDNAAYPDRVMVALETAQQFSATEGHFVSTVRANFTEDRTDRAAADQFLRQLALAGKGQFVDAAGGESMIGNVLLAILNT